MNNGLAMLRVDLGGCQNLGFENGDGIDSPQALDITQADQAVIKCSAAIFLRLYALACAAARTARAGAALQTTTTAVACRSTD